MSVYANELYSMLGHYEFSLLCFACLRILFGLNFSSPTFLSFCERGHVWKLNAVVVYCHSVCWEPQLVEFVPTFCDVLWLKCGFSEDLYSYFLGFPCNWNMTGQLYSICLGLLFEFILHLHFFIVLVRVVMIVNIIRWIPNWVTHIPSHCLTKYQNEL